MNAAASGAVAVGVFVAALVFGASLSRVLETPSDYGWRWDVASIDDYGYGQTGGYSDYRDYR